MSSRDRVHAAAGVTLQQLEADANPPPCKKKRLDQEIDLKENVSGTHVNNSMLLDIYIIDFSYASN